MGQLDFIKNFCASNKTIKKVKIEPTEWEKIIASYLMKDLYRPLTTYTKKDNSI